MFTIRVETGAPQRTVYSTKVYSVERRETGTVIVLDSGREVVLAEGQRAYVMNAEGNTVDRIGDFSRAAAQFRTG